MLSDLLTAYLVVHFGTLLFCAVVVAYREAKARRWRVFYRVPAAVFTALVVVLAFPVWAIIDVTGRKETR